MNWLALAGLLWKLFGPVIEAWLKSLMERNGPPLPARALDTPTAIREYFAAARARTTWREYLLFARRRLSALERVALKHAAEIRAASEFGSPAPALDAEDAAELALAV